MLQNLQNFAKFQNFQLDNLVDFEKCCKTRIYLQRSAPIQPKTSEILPKFGNYPTGRSTAPARRLGRRLQRGGGCRWRRRGTPRLGLGVRVSKIGNFANFWRARSRLYQNEILQENMRLTAFFKLYNICTRALQDFYKN